MIHQRTAGLTTLLCAAMSLTAHAQPDPKAPGLKQNPQNLDPDAMIRQAQQAGMQQAMKMLHMTPQERQAEMQRILQQLLRTNLDQAGFKDQTLQATILKFVADQEASRQAVRVAAARLLTVLDPGGNAGVTPATVGTYIEDYLVAVEDAKAAREAAATDLDKQIGFSKTPRLKGWLLVNGLIGEAAWLTGNITMMSTMSVSALGMLPQVKPNVAPATDVAPAPAAATPRAP